MPWIGGAIAGGLGLLGSSMQSSAQRQAAETSAQAQLEAARQAAEAAKFRPVGVTTGFGASQFQFSPEGYLSSAGYQLSPELQAQRQRLMGLAGMGLTQAEQAPAAYAPLGQAAQGLFNLGQQYLAQSPEQVAQRYMQQQQSLLAPGREQQLANLQNQMFQTGRGGLAVGGTSGAGGSVALGATNPELQAYYNAMAQQDAALAAQAQQAGQQQLAFGAGLFGTGANLLGGMYGGQVAALSPYTSYLGGAGSVEELGQQALNLGSNLGGRTAAAGANVGQSLLRGGMSAAGTLQEAQNRSPFGTFLSNTAGMPEFRSGLQKYFGPSTGIPIDALNTSAYGSGLMGYENAMADIYGR
jgi:hypothetical protein